GGGPPRSPPPRARAPRPPPALPPRVPDGRVGRHPPQPVERSTQRLGRPPRLAGGVLPRTPAPHRQGRPARPRGADRHPPRPDAGPPVPAPPRAATPPGGRRADPPEVHGRGPCPAPPPLLAPATRPRLRRRPPPPPPPSL